MIRRDLAEGVFADAVRACDPAVRVRDALLVPDMATRLADRQRFGLAIGKAAVAMARGAGPVEQGLVIAPGEADGALPLGWTLLVSSHPAPDARSLAAAAAALALVARASSNDIVLALISGGTSSLIEDPRGDLTLDELVEVTTAVMRAGASIRELNAVRSALSRVKAGGLVRACAAPVITLAVSDVVDDDLTVIGSGPTIRNAVRGLSARDVLAHYGIRVSPRIAAVLADADVAAATATETETETDAVAAADADADLARVIALMSAFARAAYEALVARGVAANLVEAPLVGDVARAADMLAESSDVIVAWGEPTLVVPETHGEGGRAQQLALELAKRLQGTSRSALVVGSDGADGPAPRTRPTPAGAFVDGSTWDAIARAGIDPQVALDTRDAGTALGAVGALVVTGPTGVNHADLVILG